jgi:hypothetical protein
MKWGSRRSDGGGGAHGAVGVRVQDTPAYEYGTRQHIQDRSAYTVHTNGLYGLSSVPRSDPDQIRASPAEGYRTISAVHVFPAESFREKGVYILKESPSFYYSFSS